MDRKYTFVRIHDNKYDQDRGWALKISNILEYMDYRHVCMDEEAAAVMKSMGEMQKAEKRPSGTCPHAPYPTDSRDAAIYNVVLIKGELKGSINIQDLIDTYDGFSKAKLRTLDREGCIYVYPNHSFNIPMNDWEETEEVITDQLLYPTTEHTIEISKWKNGIHYYLSCDKKAMELNGKTKWALYTDAVAIIEKYMRETHPNDKYKIVRKIAVL